jgi:serine/threonine protein kinase
MEDNVVWYEVDAETGDQLRSYLAQRGTKTEKQLEILSTSSISYIDNFTSYVTVDNERYCKRIFQDRFPYVVGSVIGSGKVGQAALLSRNKINLVIKSISAKSPKYLSLRLIDHPGDTVNPWNTAWQIFDQNNNRKIIAVGGDNFANQTSIHLILNIILRDNPHYIHQYDAFYCDGLGYNIMEYSDGGDLHKFLETNVINDDVIFSVISHVLTPLSILKHPIYNFNHSDLKTKNIFVNKTESGLVFKIADYDKSSITWHGFRFYNWSYNYGTASPIKIEKSSEGTDVYILSSMINLQLHTMHNPYGIPMSYDIYTFIISLFGSKNIWNKYINGELPRFKHLMHQLFKGEQYYVIMGKIVQDHSAVVSMGKINNILNGVYLQYDLSYVYRLVGLIAPPLTPLESERRRITISKDGHLCTDSCTINKALSPDYETCTTNTYSKTKIGIVGPSTTLYNWDYCTA